MVNIAKYYEQSSSFFLLITRFEHGKISLCYLCFGLDVGAFANEKLDHINVALHSSSNQAGFTVLFGVRQEKSSYSIVNWPGNLNDSLKSASIAVSYVQNIIFFFFG